MKYLNVYSVSREYGGSEEGGWWYDEGHPLASIPIDTDNNSEIESKKEELKKMFAHEQSPRHRSSVLGGTDVEVYEEDSFAQPFPKNTPHYE